ncbi:hypothetical protein [Clostridium kluyveri]|uniref:Uncharacterized protein n=1 Tax=Clostridium kluyveri (strain ATCC 8527 / DSM 555 / NBRC 12016 / NCIMB 10680 / K1) TaxID=431943 RepID=A5N2B4_CLOK5|nr:hypothetical protein [Clostridium kluyveri]EDK35260.1 Hypothetical protein CKL_3257 [Clostridium kluyveri DSM 555]
MTAVEVREQFVGFTGDYLDRITLKSKNLAEKIDLEHITDCNKELFVSEMYTFISDLFGI